MQFRADELFSSLSSQHAGEGFLDFSATLTLQGFDADEMTRTAQGEAALRGANLRLNIGNLDEKFSRYESSQSFNLVDVGAFFLAGPLGPLVTKGYNFANIFMAPEGVTTIPTLISNWKVERGVAQAQDVAMTTQKNRLALRGGLDFVNRRFADVTVALLDAKGCARIEQKISGSFRQPEVTKPNVLISLAGPVRKLVTQAKDLLGEKCAVFYAGSVAPPQ
jgi:AsmA protein